MHRIGPAERPKAKAPRVLTLWCQSGGHSYEAVCTDQAGYVPFLLFGREICAKCLLWLWRNKPDTFALATVGDPAEGCVPQA